MISLALLGLGFVAGWLFGARRVRRYEKVLRFLTQRADSITKGPS